MRILAFAYACEPGRGSEPAAGWAWARLLAGIGEVWVLTRASNRVVIDRELAARPMPPNVHFVYVDPSEKVTRWKRGQRGVRLYYILWQFAALREARHLARSQRFDLVWHLTFANAWLGSAACLLRIPFVYGPVGGGVAPPVRLVSALGVRGAVYEAFRAIARTWGRYLNPLARLSWRRAQLVLVQNEETRGWLPRRYRGKAAVFQNVVLDRLPAASQHPRPHQVMLFAGRLTPLKGVSLALRALPKLPGWRLLVCGEGPDESRLRLLAQKYGVQDRVDFRGWVDREVVLETMRDEASVFVFPSLHDEAGWVVVEAMASGLPVVCLDVGGPPLLSGRQFVVMPAGTRVTADRIASAVLEATHIDYGVARRRAQEFLFPARLDQLRRVLDAAGLLTLDW